MKKIRMLRGRVIRSMTDVLAETDDYTQDDIDECENILVQFSEDLKALSSTGNKRDEILEVVKGAILSLNRLNSSCEEKLIEQEQGDDLCELMAMAAQNAGFVSDIYNVIDNLREW